MIMNLWGKLGPQGQAAVIFFGAIALFLLGFAE